MTLQGNRIVQEVGHEAHQQCGRRSLEKEEKRSTTYTVTTEVPGPVNFVIFYRTYHVLQKSTLYFSKVLIVLIMYFRKYSIP